MNLWVKRTGQLLLAALFLLACEDEASLLGFRNPKSKFDVRFIEFPVHSSVLWLDSVRSSNFYWPNEINRLLLGSYTDEKLGSVSAGFYTQYFPTTTAKIATNSTLDSAVLQLKLDFYTYGNITMNPIQFEVYELAKQISRNSAPFYFNKTTVPTGPLVGSGSLIINPLEFRNKFDSAKKDTVLIRIPLSSAFSQKLFNAALRYANGTTPQDSLQWRDFSTFTKEFKGLAVKAVSGDKIVGIDPVHFESRIIVHYQNPTLDSQTINIPIAGNAITSFNEIKSDRTGSEVEVSQYFTDFDPVTGLRCVQSGVGLFTKLDFSEFISFLESDTIPDIAINSAELVITDVESTEIFRSPGELYVRLLDPDNRLKKFNRQNTPQARDRDLKIMNLYNNSTRTLTADNFVVNPDSVLTIFTETSTNFNLGYSASSNSYRGFFTLFAQELAIPETDKPRFRYFILYPKNGAKTVNRVLFHKDKIKLRVYYTLPKAD
ncbi:MAG: DUF4270 family protein [Flammeovirgaceae bacterium]|nr:MAG: DUF4270 family protein [Flammeovirgaceae bacterium]